MRTATRSRSRRGIAALALVLLVSAFMVAIARTPARATVATASVDNQRTSWDSAEPGLSPSNVSATDFGRLFSTPVDGQVYAEPLVVQGTLVVATEKNKVYGLDPATGAIRWTRSLGPSWPASAIGCADLAPNVGVTSTPVYDPTTNSIFVMAKVNDGATVNTPHWYLHSLNPTTGTDRAGWPLAVQGTPSNDPQHAFNAKTEMQRPGLLLLNGVVYAGFASLCDIGPYVGYVVGASTSTAKITSMWSTEAGSASDEGGIWQGGGGLVADTSGNIIVATGNGVAPAPGPGNAPPSTLGESVVRLSVGSDGTLAPIDFFSPANNDRLNQDDADLGSGGPVLLPSSFGTPSHPHPLVQIGKDGRVWLLDADDLGGTAQGANGSDRVIASAGPFQGFRGGPAVWGGDGGYVYEQESRGYLRALQYGVDGKGNPTLASTGTSAGTFGFSSGSPTVTSTGTTSGSALVWTVWSPGTSSTAAELRAYDAVPVNGVLRQRYAAPIGSAVKFTRVATDSGRVYVGTMDGHIIGFGRPTTASLMGSPTDFGDVATGSTGNTTVTVTATRAVTINGVSTTAPFSVAPPALPLTLASGQTATFPVSFAPTVAGPQSAALTFATSSGAPSFDLSGRGTTDGLAADPSPLDFGQVPTGTTRDLTVNISNTGSDPATITGVTPPTAPFSADSLPAIGTVIPPAGSVSVPISYRPTDTTADSSTLTLSSDRGSVSLPATGTPITGNAQLTVSPNPLAFGSVAVGTTATATFDIANTGNIVLELSKAAPPAAPFTVPSPVAEGQQIGPGDVLHVTVDFTPTATGPVSATYQITSDDGRGPQNLMLTGTGVTDPIAAKAASLVGTTNAVGSPTSAEKAVGTGRMQTFAHGTIYWSSATGAHVVKGAILAEYTKLAGPTGLLGFPTTDQTATTGGTGFFNTFAKKGSIYWSTASGAHEVHGAIALQWQNLGAEHGRLGFPTTDEFSISGGGRRETFQHGSLTYLNGVVTG